MDDNDIIELFWQRDERAAEETAKKYTGYCRAIAAQILRSPEDAEEAVNETWFSAWKSIPPHRPLSLRQFLGALTRRLCWNMIRADCAKKRADGEQQLVYEELENMLVSAQDVEQEVSDQELADAVSAFLGNCSERDRNVFLRRYVRMQTIDEIAESTGFSESKVKSMLFRIRKKLRAKLKKEGYL